MKGHQMLGKNKKCAKKEEKFRRKKLLTLFREDQRARVWNEVLDEMGFCDITAALDPECWSLDSAVPRIDSELEGYDEDYPNKEETLHNIFECD